MTVREHWSTLQAENESQKLKSQQNQRNTGRADPKGIVRLKVIQGEQSVSGCIHP